MPRVRAAGLLWALLLLSLCLHACSIDSAAACPQITNQCIAAHVRDILAQINTVHSSALDLSLILGVTIPVTIVMLLLALLALVVVMRHSKRTLFGRPWVPAAGNERTTLVVTDIMDSTALWEMLDASGMSRAVATHNSVVRKALARFHGYEQATEGDSFLVAFHTPCDALRFAVQLQAGLLSADWDPELLAHPSCAPVAMTQSAALLSVCGGDDRFQLRCAAAMLAAMGGVEGHGRWRHTRISIAGLFESISEVVAVASQAPGASAMRGTATMAEFMQLALVETGTREAGTCAPKGQAAIMFRGLRVRIGMHSGVSKTDVERNATAGRMFFIGTPLALAKAVDHAGAGGMILMTQVKDAGLNPVCLCQAIARPLVPRLAAFEALRDVEKLQLSVLDATLGNVTIAFVNIVGMLTLQAWNKDHAARALSVCCALSTRLLRQAGGYLVELTSSGMCVAAFREPASAVAWGLCLIEVMKHADCDEELLAHELCKKVLVHAPDTGGTFSENGTPRAGRVLFRGPRVKVGIDVGQVQGDVSPVTGRMTH
ncbi:hypothetical protein FOA52_006402 [Chlamydomonas sp. UWO 241]|nr:hypothetical protein FOA52_006402 [Chlamydomonas sp. UWO 241]